MGLWTTIKGWLNIGGVQVLLWKYTEPLSRSNPVITGAILLKTKSDKTVLSLEVRVVEEFTQTEGEGEDKQTKTKRTVLGSVKFPDRDPGIGYPLDLKPGKNRQQPFTVQVALIDRLQHAVGRLGSLGKVAALLAQERAEYFLIAEARVQGAAFATADKKNIKIGD